MSDAERIEMDIRKESLREKSLQIKHKVLKKVYKQRRQIDDIIVGVYNGSIAFFEIMLGKRKIAPKYLSLE